MTIKVVTTIQELAHLTADKMFEEMREHVHKLDDELCEAGMDAPTFVLLLLARLSAHTTEYAAYMAAGLYLVADQDEALARGSVKALLQDCKVAAKAGLHRAEQQADEINDELRDAEQAVSDLLKRANGKCH